MITADDLLAGARYRDVDVVTVTPTSLSARVDGRLVEVDLEATPALHAELRGVYRPGVERLRIAQADLASVRTSELDPDQTEAWLVVADPVREAPAPRAFASPFTAALTTRYASGLTADEISMWPHLCAIIDEAVHDGGQSSSRNGAVPRALQCHHSTMLSDRAYIDMVQRLLRQVSSNLAIGVDGKITRLVNLLRRAWTSGSASFDAAAITVEAANSTLAPDYRMSAATKRAYARIAAAIKADRGLQALTRDAVYLHKEMLPRWGVSYATACLMDTTAAQIIADAERITFDAAHATIQEETMAVIRISDWAGRHYLADSLGHTYIPSLTAASALIKMSRQDAAVDLDFASFFEAVSLINTNLRGSVLGKGLDALAPKATVRMASASMTRSARPDWCDPDVWDEAVKRGIAKA